MAVAFYVCKITQRVDILFWGSQHTWHALVKEQDIVEMLINMSWLKEMERKEKDMFTGVVSLEK